MKNDADTILLDRLERSHNTVAYVITQVSS